MVGLIGRMVSANHRLAGLIAGRAQIQRRDIVVLGSTGGSAYVREAAASGLPTCREGKTCIPPCR